MSIAMIYAKTLETRYSKPFFIWKFSNGMYDGLKIAAVQYLPTQGI